MKQLVSFPFNGYMFWRISRTASLKLSAHQYGRYFSAVKPVQEIFSKPVLDSKKHKNNHIVKRFSSNAEDSVILMNFEVWIRPKIFQIIKDFYNFHFVLKDLDSFSLVEFVSCSAKALQVVATLLSELRFPELENLLTPDCKEEVTKNLQSWSKPEASFLSFGPENLIHSIPCDILIFSDEQNKEKKFVEIRVIHYVWLGYSSKFGKKAHNAVLNKFLLEATNNNKKVCMIAVYNCKYIKEITEGITDQWTINKINLKCFPNVLHRF